MNWAESVKIGELDEYMIDEASGLAVSPSHKDRLYHINDSGGGPYFYISDMNGSDTRKIKLKGYYSEASDMEDLSIGTCKGESTCLFIADIGDNKTRREYVEIVVVEERESYPDDIIPVKNLKIKYPDRPHNAESMAVHPNGDIYILTKEENLDDLKAFPGQMFKLGRDKWLNSRAGEILTLERFGELDLTQLNKSAGSAYGQVATALDISPDGKKLLLLTYEDAFEFDIDLSRITSLDNVQWKEDENFSRVNLISLQQQEGVAYLPGAESFIYDTEFHFFRAPIMRVDCRENIN